MRILRKVGYKSEDAGWTLDVSDDEMFNSLLPTSTMIRKAMVDWVDVVGGDKKDDNT